MALTDAEIQVIEAFGDAILARDFTAAGEFLAPWLNSSGGADALATAVEREVAEMRDEWELADTAWPAVHRLDTNPLGIDDLRKTSFGPGSDIAPEVTAENFIGWQVLEFQPAEDDDELELDAWFDLWFALVATADGPRVGSYELSFPD